MNKVIITMISLCFFSISLNSFAFCSGQWGSPEYEACEQREEAIKIQKQMLEEQRKQAEQQRIDNAMRNAEQSLRPNPYKNPW